MLKKFKKKLYNFIKNDGITAILALVIIVTLYIKITIVDKQNINFINYTMLSSIIFTAILGVCANTIKKKLMNKLEDSIKLTDNYKDLVSKYEADFITYNNHYNKDANSNEINYKRDIIDFNCNLIKLQKLHKTQDTEFYFPVICDYKLRNCFIDIRDSSDMYKIPDIINEHFDELLSAHGTSNIYNQLNIRVDDWTLKNNVFTINTSRTTYYSSLVTNRAMDFSWKNGMTVRDSLEYGPFIPPLKDSVLSNHLGFNVFIQSSDGYIPFIKRRKNLSIGKFTYGNSVEASLETKYALNNSGAFTIQGLINGIVNEISDELKISSNKLIHFNTQNIIAAYRDIVEGGKPQLLFYIKSLESKAEIEKNFFSVVRKKNKKNGKDNKETPSLEDGTKFLWLPIKDIQNQKICIAPDMLVYRKKVYRMVPSASACLVMLIEYLNERM